MHLVYLNYKNGGNNFINNTARYQIYYKKTNSGWLVIDDYSNTRVLNNNSNYGSNGTCYTTTIGGLGLSFFDIPLHKRGIYSYNSDDNGMGVLFNISETGTNGSPSNEFLNLDLTRNTQGRNGGSYAWDNYYSQNSTGNYRLNKARIVDLNLPTQIFDPANISIKVKATHKN